MSQGDLLAGSAYSDGQADLLEELRDLIEKLIKDGKPVPKEILEFAGFE